MQYWEQNRLKEKKLFYQIVSGIPVGLLFALPVLLILFSSRYWYKRADMLIRTELSPLLMSSAVFLIALFVAIFYKRHGWEMREQQYEELKAKEQREKKEGSGSNEE